MDFFLVAFFVKGTKPVQDFVVSNYFYF